MVDDGKQCRCLAASGACAGKTAVSVALAGNRRDRVGGAAGRGLAGSGTGSAEDGKRALVPVILGIAVGGYLVAYATLGLSTTPASGSAADITTAGMWAFDSQNGQVGASWTGEFLPNTVTEQRWAIGRAPSDGSSAAALPRVEMSALPQKIGYDAAAYAGHVCPAGQLDLSPVLLSRVARAGGWAGDAGPRREFVGVVSCGRGRGRRTASH